MPLDAQPIDGRRPSWSRPTSTRIRRDSPPRRDDSFRLSPYAAATLTVALTTALRSALDPILGAHHPYSLFVFPVLLAASRAGWKPGVFALVLSISVANFLFVAPRGSIWVEDPENWLGLAIYLLVAGAAVYLAESWRAARHLAAVHAFAAAQEAAAHRETQEELRRRQERERADEQLRQSEERFRSAFEDTNVAMVLTDPGHRFVRVNAAFARLFGYTPEEMLALSMADVTHPDDIAESLSRRGPLASGSADYFQMEKRYLRKEGGIFWGLANVSVVRDARGRPAQFVGQVQDVTDRRRAEESLRVFRALIDRTNDSVEVIDPETGRFLDVNQTACRSHGYTREEYLALGVEDLDPSVASEPWREVAEGVRRAGSRIVEGSHRRKDGSSFPVEVNVNYIRLDRDYMLAVVRDVSERKRVEAERDRALARLHLQIERLPLACVLCDPDIRYVGWNPAAERTFGFTKEEARGKGPFDLIVPPQSHDIVTEVFDRLRAGDMNAHGACENVTKDGRTIFCEWHNTPLFGPEGSFAGILSLAQDVTERRHLEDQYRQSQKMEVVGQLAGGVAHDFNNLLCVINGYGELLLTRLPEGDPAREMIREMTKAGERAAALTRQLLAFSRKAVLAPEIVDLNAVVADMEKMLRRTIGEDVDLGVGLQPGLGRVKADRGQVEQVLMNLCVNARDAMPKGGKLTVETRDIELDETYAGAHAEARPGPHVLLAVSDTGHGMTEEVKARIFEPFFTTKEKGRGTGLGLSTVFGIVKQSGGSIEVYSEPGRGTAFKVYLPRVEKAAALRKSSAGLRPAPRGAETVLLVEDEDSVRALARIVLTGSGYAVLEAGHGEEALRIAGGHTGRIELLVSDVVMPELGGPELAGRLLALHPEMKVLFLSGYTDDAIVRHGILQEKVNFLQKPFSTVVLAQKVREVLDAES